MVCLIGKMLGLRINAQMPCEEGQVTTVSLGTCNVKCLAPLEPSEEVLHCFARFWSPSFRCREAVSKTEMNRDESSETLYIQTQPNAWRVYIAGTTSKLSNLDTKMSVASSEHRARQAVAAAAQAAQASPQSSQFSPYSPSSRRPHLEPLSPKTRLAPPIQQRRSRRCCERMLREAQESHLSHAALSEKRGWSSTD
eukprot:s812_g5.t1